MFLMWLKLEKKIPAIALLGNMLLLPPFYKRKGFTGGSDGKPAMHETWVQSPVSGRSPGEGNGTRLQYSCLENPKDRGAWRATVHGVSKSWTQLSN